MKKQGTPSSRGTGRFFAGVGASVLALAISGPAFAQDAEATIDETTGEPEVTGEAIVVTGSRIKRDEFTSAAPITVVDPAIASKQGLISTADMVQGSPIAAGSDQVTSALSAGFLTNGGVGAETVSLRGLGAERTLVLLNGRRAGPAGTRGGVSSFDLNVLPQAIIQRVDVLKDGASSIYGSDAVAGVVNMITRTDTNGLEINLFANAPFESGGEEKSASALWGKSFDRGHIMLAGNYSHRSELSRGDRSYLQCGENYVFTNESYDVRADLIDPRTGRYACGGSDGANTWGHVWTYDYTYLDNNGDGLADFGRPGGSNLPGSAGDGSAVLIQYSYPGDNLGLYLDPVTNGGPASIRVPAGWYALGNDAASSSVTNRYHPLMDNDTVIPESKSYTAYLDAAFEMSDAAEFYTELLFNRRDTFVNASGQIYQFGLGEIYDYYYDYNGDGLQDTDPYVSFPFDPYANGFAGPALFSPTGFSPYADSSVKVDYYRAVGGVRGDISSKWSYDLYGQFSRSDGTYRDQTALKDAIGCANFRSGAKGYSSRRCPGGVTPVSGRTNVIVDWYSPRVMFGDFTQAEYDFLFAWDEGNTRYDQKYVEGIVSGELFDLPGGTVGVAAGATIRKDSIDDVPGEIRQADNGFNFGGAGRTFGNTVTKEAFGELSLPLIADKPFFQNVELSAAARVTNVTATRGDDGLQDTSNGNITYKLGINWEVSDLLRLRGTYGTSFRAPALFEQFLANQTGGVQQRNVDPCIQWGLNLAQGNISQRLADNCAADGVDANHTGAGVSSAIVSGGGIGVLEPETSRAFTVSAVLTPSFEFLPDTRISLAVDYFDIEVNGEIAQLGGAGILSSCYNSDFFPNDPLCAQFSRFSDFDENPDSPLAQQYDIPGGDRDNVAVIFDKFFNINSQKNRGVDVTTRVVHDFGSDTRLTFQGQMTWQTLDTIALFDGFEEDNNGEAGDPIFVGDFFLSLERGPWTAFYGLDVIGATDDREDYIDANGSLCPTFVALGTVCAQLQTPATFYHSFSVTREIEDKFDITVGLTNIFDTNPPRTSQLGGDGTRSLGTGLLYSQYDLRGRRAFINVKFAY